MLSWTFRLAYGDIDKLYMVFEFDENFTLNDTTTTTTTTATTATTTTTSKYCVNLTITPDTLCEDVTWTITSDSTTVYDDFSV